MSSTILLPFQSDWMSRAQLAAVSYLARYSDTHSLYASQLRRWFAWCETNALDPLVGIERAYIEFVIRHLGGSGLMASSVNTMMHGVPGGSSGSPTSTGSSPATPRSTPGYRKIHRDESRTQGLDRLELIRCL